MVLETWPDLHRWGPQLPLQGEPISFPADILNRIVRTQKPGLFHVLAVLCVGAALPAGCSTIPPPNVVVLLADDLGYSDLALYADTGLATPHLERMAEAGMRFTDFSMPAASCSPSRAALLTGMYPQRVGIPGVLMPQSSTGIPAEALTLAEMLQHQGYATAVYGKWHLGHRAPFLPLRHGFDNYFGIPYSNDMTPDSTLNPNPYARRHPPLPLVEDSTTVETDPDQRYLTRRYTERAVRFIEQHAGQPFFLYLAYAAPHMPLKVSPAFDGRSGHGLYSDVLLELDWSAGQILDVLEREELTSSTLVFFTSDNGPWLVKGAGSGSALPLREGKGTTFEGGHRVPAVAQWPGVIPPGSVQHEAVTAMDLMPTIAAAVGYESPTPSWDGYDITALLRDTPSATTPYAAFFYLQGHQVQAVRAGGWKLHVPHRYRSIHGAFLSTPIHPGAYVQDSIGLALFDLAADPGERINLADDHPALVDSLQGAIAQAQAMLGRPARK